MNKHIHASGQSMFALGALAMIGFSAFVALSGGGLRAAVAEDCVGKPYGTPGCPLKASSASSVRPATCGNGIVDANEECDLGSTRNGFSNCTKDCRELYCGDGLVSPAIHEECEPDSEEVYALDPATGELTIEVHYLAPTCGKICTVPTCDKKGNCFEGCRNSFLPACTVSSSSAAAGTTTSGSLVLMPGGYLATCGNGIRDDGEQCDDGNQVDIDSCSNACTIPVCGDGIAQYWEQCDDGNHVDTDGCSNTCKSPVCGDGLTQEGEECDDGNKVNNDACSNACHFPRCGDLIVQKPEECDDGNSVDGDACSNACHLPVCGDGIVQAGEQCDDGNKTNTDACTSQCITARCGDSVVQGDEQCDDGNKVNNDECSNTCKLPECGNGVREIGEDCDDGNAENGDSCTIECKRPACGDGYVQSDEECDDGNTDDNDSCTSKCKVPVCGDGIASGGEECDAGSNNSDTKPDVCRMNCHAPRCGDNVVDKGEECDGGNKCSPDCKQLKSAAGALITTNDDGASSLTVAGMALGLFGIASVLAFIFRKKLHMVVAKAGGEKLARSLDDIPLDEIEMPWQKW